MFGKIFFYLDSLLAFSQWKYAGVWPKIGNTAWLPENSYALEMDIPPSDSMGDSEKSSEDFDLRILCRNFRRGKRNKTLLALNETNVSAAWAGATSKRHMVLDSVAYTTAPASWIHTFGSL